MIRKYIEDCTFRKLSLLARNIILKFLLQEEDTFTSKQLFYNCYYLTKLLNPRTIIIVVNLKNFINFLG